MKSPAPAAGAICCACSSRCDSCACGGCRGCSARVCGRCDSGTCHRRSGCSRRFCSRCHSCRRCHGRRASPTEGRLRAQDWRRGAAARGASEPRARRHLARFFRGGAYQSQTEEQHDEAPHCLFRGLRVWVFYSWSFEHCLSQNGYGNNIWNHHLDNVYTVYRYPENKVGKIARCPLPSGDVR